MRYLSIILVFSTLLSSCISFDKPYSVIPPGVWRGVLYLDGKEIVHRELTLEEIHNRREKKVQRDVLPFLFNIVYTKKDSFYVEFINGEEKIPIHNVLIGKDLRTTKDTMLINFPEYDSYIRVKIKERKMSGVYVRTDTKYPYEIAFEATQGQNYHFTTILNEAKIDFSGKWKVRFEVETNHPYDAIGEFKQNGSSISGTFRTETGDYRYLSGNVVDSSLFLSCFDGRHLFLFRGDLQPDGKIVGSFSSGSNYKTIWDGVRNEHFKLKDPMEITRLKEPNSPFNFELINTKNQLIKFNDPLYNNDIKIIQILGTWCPNCKDESKFLVNYLKQHPEQKIRIFGCAFENTTSKEAISKLKNYKLKLHIPYDILFAGKASKEEASKVFSMLTTIKSFPTMIVLDKNNKVQMIHTGFNGPATSKFKVFEKEFSALMSKLNAS